MCRNTTSLAKTPEARPVSTILTTSSSCSLELAAIVAPLRGLGGPNHSWTSSRAMMISVSLAETWSVITLTQHCQSSVSIGYKLDQTILTTNCNGLLNGSDDRA